MIALSPRAWINSALAWVYPDVCQVCQERRATSSEGYVCSDCWKGVRFIRTPYCERCGLPFDGNITTTFTCTNCDELNLHFDWARSAVLARGVVMDAIHRYKYQHAVWFEPFLADLLIRQAGPALSRVEWDVIIPVPLHPVREREREFNQARRLARHLSRRTGIALGDHWLERVRPTQTQTLLSREQRTRNMHRAFSLRTRAGLQGASCVVVDDVFTTGATTSACARALKAAGAWKVCVWTVARGV